MSTTPWTLTTRTKTADAISALPGLRVIAARLKYRGEAVTSLEIDLEDESTLHIQTLVANSGGIRAEWSEHIKGGT